MIQSIARGLKIERSKHNDQTVGISRPNYEFHDYR